jgi:hypothetical protein
VQHGRGPGEKGDPGGLQQSQLLTRNDGMLEKWNNGNVLLPQQGRIASKSFLIVRTQYSSIPAFQEPIEDRNRA